MVHLKSVNKIFTPAVMKHIFYRGLIVSYPNEGVEISASTSILDPNGHVLS